MIKTRENIVNECEYSDRMQAIMHSPYELADEAAARLYGEEYMTFMINTEDAYSVVAEEEMYKGTLDFVSGGGVRKNPAFDVSVASLEKEVTRYAGSLKCRNKALRRRFGLSATKH